jgi:hypothetical protein
VEFATSAFKADTIGIARWLAPDSRDVGALSLELPYAQHIVTGAIASTFPADKDIDVEIDEAVKIIMGSYPKIQAATYAPFYEFLWSKFGR